jgi:hypothetical protein
VVEKVGPAAETYDVCLSFAAEQRHYVADVARLLKSAGVAVFYDEYETADLLGRDLYTHLSEVYGHDSRYCVLFASADYARKIWTNHERKSAQERALRSRTAYILPVRFDDTRIPGLLDSIGYIDARRTSPAELVLMINAKLDTDSAPDPLTSTMSVIVLASAEPDVALTAILIAALSACRMNLPPALVARSDHRVVALLPSHIASKSDVLTFLLPAIEEEVVQRRTLAQALRISVHGGEVVTGGEWDSETTIDATTMADAPVLRDILETTPRARILFVLSQRWYQDVIHTANPRSNPADYQAVELSDSQVGWVRVPGYPKRSDSQTQQDAGGRRNYFYGDVMMGRIGDNNNYYFGGGSDGQ